MGSHPRSSRVRAFEDGLWSDTKWASHMKCAAALSGAIEATARSRCRPITAQAMPVETGMVW